MLTYKDISDLIIPQYFIFTFLTPIASYLVINGGLPNYEIIPVIISLSLAVVGFNSSNMVHDYEIDKINKPKRPVASGAIDKSSAMKFSFVSFLLALLIAYFVNFLFLCTIVLFVIVSFMYNSHTFFRKNFLASSIAGGVQYGFLPFFSAYSISTNSFPVFFGIFFSVLVGIAANNKDLEDVVGEKKHKIQSLPVLIGIDASAKVMVLSLGVLFLVSGTLSVLSVIAYNYFFASVLSLLFLLLFSMVFFEEVKKIEDFQKRGKIVTQSRAVTLTMLFLVLVELIFGVVSTLHN